MKILKIDDKIKNNKFILISGISFLIYSIIEIIDTLALLFIILNIIPNIYYEMDLIIGLFIRDYTLYLFPLFLSFTVMRIITTIGIFNNRLWGFWIGIISLVITMILTIILFLPIGCIELFFCAFILIFIIIGYCGNKNLIE